MRRHGLILLPLFLLLILPSIVGCSHVGGHVEGVEVALKSSELPKETMRQCEELRHKKEKSPPDYYMYEYCITIDGTTKGTWFKGDTHEVCAIYQLVFAGYKFNKGDKEVYFSSEGKKLPEPITPFKTETK